MINEAFTSWKSVTFVAEVLITGKGEKIPILLVNPTLEQVTLKPTDSGSWRTSTVESYTRWGFTPLQKLIPSNRTPVQSVPVVPSAKMDRSEILVTINPGSEWSAPIDRSFFSIARRLGGLHVWVSTSLLPDNEVRLGIIEREIARGNVAARWVSFDSSSERFSQ